MIYLYLLAIASLVYYYGKKKKEIQQETIRKLREVQEEFEGRN